jgi:hypothetical protein
MAATFDRFTDAVAPDGHVVVFIGDMYREQSYEFLSAELAQAIESTAPLTLIWASTSTSTNRAFANT